MPRDINEQIAIITGDITMDWNLARTRHSKNDTTFWSADDTTSATWQCGGSTLLADIIVAVAKNLQRSDATRYSIRQADAPRNSTKVQPDSDQYNHSFALWSPFKYGEKPAWRVEEFLGINRTNIDLVQDWQKVVNDTPEAGMIVLDDADLGFRTHPELWPMALHLRRKNQPWILLKMARRLAQGPLWEHLHQNCSERLIVVATVDDLRLNEVQISQELSWERTAQDVFWELVHNPCVNSLSDCAHVVISFGPSGTILLSHLEGKDQPRFQCTLYFDPKGVERMWEMENPGGMVGYTTCLVAGLSRELLRSLEKPDLPAGILSGLSAMRTLHLEGYGERGTPASRVKLSFPIEKIAAALAQPAYQFTIAPIQDPMLFIHQKGESSKKTFTVGFWTILQDKFKSRLDQVAMQVVLEGPECALLGVPWGQFGNLLTVDRQEIESYRGIRNLVEEYARQEKTIRPLSIAVFGTPGSGKSFGITEMAKSLLPGRIEPITFNLSQFDAAEALLSAFHQVRDICLTGKLPLVFWDEFDTSLEGTPLGWLRYFLAPMQDGKFQEGQISHPIGPAIFVFAGGTSSSMAEFDRAIDKDFKSAKGPDFVSRLKGFINVLGPNPVKGNSPDPYFIIRRAILLRSCLKRNYPQLFEKSGGKELLNIDRGVLRALLKIGQYKHGARSIESLLAMSQLTEKTAFERSSLPSRSQLDLHVEGNTFLSLVQQIELEGPMLDSLAEAANEVFGEGLKARGVRYNRKSDEKRKTHSALLPFAELPEEMKENNRSNVRDIPSKLAMAGYIMIPARSNELPFEFPDGSLEELAEAEHARWMAQKLEDGWSYGPKTDSTKKAHECLVPWKTLPEEEKEKDRDLVRGIPKILARAGFTIVKSDE